jgi:hypothetical protein
LKGEKQMKRILKLIGKIIGGLIGLIVLAVVAVMAIGYFRYNKTYEVAVPRWRFPLTRRSSQEANIW